ncbi:Fic family protein [Limibacter armeniacum]|uniref:Fic family protein n=1 Tax=Limibacter armeniacum TaxID=466084 RepID=UPI002FE66250
MSISAHFSFSAPIFYGRKLPEEGLIVGYGAIIHQLELPMPQPAQVAVICQKNRKYQTDFWKVFPKQYLPDDQTDLSQVEALYKHLTFALKYEGVNLLFFSLLCKYYGEAELRELVSIEPTGQYSRKMWFLIEWVRGEVLSGLDDLSKKSYVPLLDEKLQYGVEGVKSPRHLVINNLPGTRLFCPLIFRTEKLDQYIDSKLSIQNNSYLENIRKDILQRASAFLLLKDSKASFSIEGENPKSKRAARWGQAIGQAGSKDLNVEEVIRLQQIVIENARFVTIGLRQKGGFVGEHDRLSGEPVPEHISARWQDLETLMEGLVATNQLLLERNIDAVLAATLIAFGFVFIHPLEDGNGRIHRYLIHHILAKKGLTQQGIIFPVSASILDHINDYREVLESYSIPLLDFIDWKETPDHNVEVLNDTVDYYRYFDATRQAEFLYDCVYDTIHHIIPEEVTYLRQYDEFKRYLDNEYEMPDTMVALLVRFLEQYSGKLSKRAKEKEFSALTASEVLDIEAKFEEIFLSE